MRLREIVHAAAQQAIVMALDSNAGNRSAAARQLGVNRTEFYRICRRYGVKMGPSPKSAPYRQVAYEWVRANP